jgi:hypothetical protein
MRLARLYSLRLSGWRRSPLLEIPETKMIVIIWNKKVNVEISCRNISLDCSHFCLKYLAGLDPWGGNEGTSGGDGWVKFRKNILGYKDILLWDRNEVSQIQGWRWHIHDFFPLKYILLINDFSKVNIMRSEIPN